MTNQTSNRLESIAPASASGSVSYSGSNQYTKSHYEYTQPQQSICTPKQSRPDLESIDLEIISLADHYTHNKTSEMDKIENNSITGMITFAIF